MEMRASDGWRTVSPPVTRWLPPGSISSEDPEGRQVYLFGWVDGEGPGVWRSKGGFDEELGAGREFRNVFPMEGLELLAELEDGPYVTEWRRPGGTEIRVRFRLVPG